MKIVLDKLCCQRGFEFFKTFHLWMRKNLEGTLKTENN